MSKKRKKNYTMKVSIARPEGITGNIVNLGNDIETLGAGVDDSITGMDFLCDFAIFCYTKDRPTRIPQDCGLFEKDSIGTIVIAGVRGDEVASFLSAFTGVDA